MKCLNHVDVIILAGGLGTRLQSVVSDRPKILAPVRGRPILDWQLNWLKIFGPKRVLLSLGYMAEVVEDYLRKNNDWSFEVRTLTEPKPLGTGGALLYCSSQCTREHLLVINGDTLLQANLCRFVEFHLQAGVAASLMCAKTDNPSGFGTIETRDGRIVKFDEKKEIGNTSSLVNAGGYLFNRKIITQLPKDNTRSLENNILPLLIENGMAPYMEQVKFLDIGTPKGIALANQTWDDYGFTQH